jgi:hypothetical protein
MPKNKAVARARGGVAKVQPVAQEARGGLQGKRLGGVMPPEGHFLLAKQHGLTREEAEKLFQTFQELQNLGKLIKFGQDQSVVFSDPFPEITVSVENDNRINPLLAISLNPKPKRNDGRSDKAGQTGRDKIAIKRQ